MKGTRLSVSEADLHAYVDGGTGAERRQEIEAFLAREPQQAARVEMWRRQNEIVRATFSRIASEPVPLSLSLLRAAPNRPAPVTRLPLLPPIHEPIALPGGLADAALRSRSRYGAVVGSAAFVAGALTAIGVSLLLAEDSRHAATEAPVRTLTPVLLQQDPDGSHDEFVGSLFAVRAIEAHETYARDLLHPVEVDAADAVSLSIWLSRLVALPISPPDLRADGLRLIGGRVTPGENGPAAYLLYESGGGEKIGVVVARLPRLDSLTLRYQKSHSTGAAIWIANGAGYAVVGRLERDDLLAIAGHIRDEIASPR